MRSVWVKDLESVNSKSVEEITLLTSFCIYYAFPVKMEYWFNHHKNQNLFGDWILFCLTCLNQALILRYHWAGTMIFLPVFRGTEGVNDIKNFRSTQSLIIQPNLKTECNKFLNQSFTLMYIPGDSYTSIWLSIRS